MEKMWLEDDPVVTGGTIGGVCKPSRKGKPFRYLACWWGERMGE